MKNITVLLLTLMSMNLFGQSNVKTLLGYWEKGEIKEAYTIAENILKHSPNNDTAIFIKMKALFVQGKYKETTKFESMRNIFEKYPEAINVVIESYLHLKDNKSALKFAETNKSERFSYLKDLKEKPFIVIADKTYIIPFIEDSSHTSDFIPLVYGSINGNKRQIMFDTGGEFLVIGKDAADTLGIKYTHEETGEHATSKVTIWHTIVDSLTFDNGPVFFNVPVVVMADLKNMIFFGTNMLEQFLSTIDYPNRRFILTPRGKYNLYEQHYQMLSENRKTLPFYLWGNHYMFAKGKFANHDSLNFFFDSGLLAITRIDNQLKQASFTASTESMLKWGFDQSKMTKNTFFSTKDTLEVAGLTQPNTLIWYDTKLGKDRNFGGIRIDGLISHAWFKNYSWTLDFDKMEYSFGVKNYRTTAPNKL